MSKQNNNPLFDGDENADRDRVIKDDLGAETDFDNLAFDEEKNSYEMDVEGDDPDYIHPDPYDTAVENGGDFDSDYDEANPTAVNEYDKDASLENDAEKLGMHIDSGNITKLSPQDEELSKTPEDYRNDLDEEGYPKNDADKDSGDNMK